MPKLFIVFLSGVWLLSLSCKKSNGLSNVNDSANPIYNLVRGAFTVVPFDTADITALVPLGNLNPPAHTFPTDHMYFYCFTLQASLPIKAPGNVQIVRIGRTHYNAGSFDDHYDYNIAMGSDNSYLYWGHVSNLSPRLLNAVNNFSTATCQPSYATGGSTFEQCYLSVSLTAAAGEILGIANAKNGIAGMDFGVSINGIGTNPLEYFTANARSMMETKLGRYNGKAKRTLAPIDGEINQDIIGTAQGNWYKQGAPKNPEDNHIALVKDNIDPSKQVFSVGISLIGLPTDVYYFVPQQAGFVNRNFADVKTDANTYCYTLGILNFPYPGNTVIPSTSVIIKLDNSNTLSVEKRNCDCNCAPYIFSANKVTYTR